MEILDFSDMPWQVIEKIIFDKRSAFIHFQSGSILKVTCPTPDLYEYFKEECIQNLGIDNCIESTEE